MNYCGYNNHQAVVVNEQRFEQYLTTRYKFTRVLHILSFSSSQKKNIYKSRCYIVCKNPVTLQLYTIK